MASNPAWRRGLQSLRPVRRVAELGSFANMKWSAIYSYRGLVYVLFGICEALQLSLVVYVMALWHADPRRLSSFDPAAAIIFCFSFPGLLILSYLLRRAAPRLAVAGFTTAFVSLVAGSLLPAVP
jgi:glucan phosphoethanolaminetransferase (alkaline phosphatase superfamily)